MKKYACEKLLITVKLISGLVVKNGIREFRI